MRSVCGPVWEKMNGDASPTHPASFHPQLPIGLPLESCSTTAAPVCVAMRATGCPDASTAPLNCRYTESFDVALRSAPILSHPWYGTPACALNGTSTNDAGEASAVRSFAAP